MGEIKDKVMKIVTVNFSVTKCPQKVHERFINYAREEASDNYSMAIKLLLDGMEGNIKEVMLYEQVMELRAELAELKEKLNGGKVKEENKTFGKKD